MLEPRWPAEPDGCRTRCSAHHLREPAGPGGICAFGVCSPRLRGAVDAAVGDAPTKCHRPKPEHDPRRLPTGVGRWGRARGALDRSLAHAACCLWRGGTAHRAVWPKLDCRLWQHTLYRRGVGRRSLVGGPSVQAVRRRLRGNAPGDAADGAALSHRGQGVHPAHRATRARRRHRVRRQYAGGHWRRTSRRVCAAASAGDLSEHSGVGVGQYRHRCGDLGAGPGDAAAYKGRAHGRRLGVGVGPDAAFAGRPFRRAIPLVRAKQPLALLGRGRWCHRLGPPKTGRRADPQGQRRRRGPH